MTSSAEPAVAGGANRARRYGGRRHGLAFSGGVVILIVAVLGALGQLNLGAAALLLGLGCFNVLYDLLNAVTFTGDSVRLTGLRIPRQLRYDDVAQARLGENRVSVVVKTVDLVPTHGRRLRIIPFQFSGFYGPGGWAALLLEIIESHCIPAEPELIKHLTHAATRSERSVREQQEGYESRKEDPPISF
jgi:hypothetical protein